MIKYDANCIFDEMAKRLPYDNYELLDWIKTRMANTLKKLRPSEMSDRLLKKWIKYYSNRKSGRVSSWGGRKLVGNKSIH